MDMKPKPKRQYCANCRYFWKNATIQGQMGYCRRFPPVPFSLMDSDDQSQEMTMYPAVADEEWCGEYREIDH